jgi:hypothetical protein
MKSQTDFTSPFSSIKGKIQQKYFNGKYPHTTQVLEAEKSWGLPSDFRSDYLGEYGTIPYSKRFKPAN